MGTRRYWERSEIISWPTVGRPYFTYWRVFSDGTRSYQYSDL